MIVGVFIPKAPEREPITEGVTLIETLPNGDIVPKYGRRAEKKAQRPAAKGGEVPKPERRRPTRLSERAQISAPGGQL